MASIFLVKDERWGSCETLEAFSTREKAEAFIGPAGDSLRVEELELDPTEYRVVDRYWVLIDFETETRRKEGMSWAIKPVGWTAEASPLTHYNGQKGDMIEAYSATSHDHAFEVAVAHKKRVLWREAKRREQLAELGILPRHGDEPAVEYPGS